MAEVVRDEETGEWSAKPILNEETGELEMNRKQPEITFKRPFRISQDLIKKQSNRKIRQNILTRAPIRDNKMSPILLCLLPSVFFVPVMAVFIIIFETILHIWAHKKNKTLTKGNIYFQSPLYPVAKEFCATCLDERIKTSISKMQDKRNFTRFGAGYLGRIVT